jgi:hypothetical protein
MAKHPIDRAERRLHVYRDLFGRSFRSAASNKYKHDQYGCGRKINRVRRVLVSDDETHQEAMGFFKRETACATHLGNYSEIFYQFAASWWKTAALREDFFCNVLIEWHKVVKGLPAKWRRNYVMPIIYCDSRYELYETLGYVGNFVERMNTEGHFSSPYGGTSSFSTIQYYQRAQGGMPFITEEGLLLLRNETGRGPLYHIKRSSNYAFMCRHQEIAETVPEDDYLNSDDCSAEEVEARQSRERQNLAGMTLDQYRNSYLTDND